ncbi:MAG TPA: carboxypeptidase-like regulatory domain-containing protein, partial [Elusimicrobiota bacterium]|nr:carboxypeptidase-like regulatory domain-containing protein [Elusimicrobiota bacterium]
MSIKRAMGWLAGIGLALGAAPATAAVSISGSVVQSSTISATPSGVALMVSTFPVTDPALANDPSVFIASAPLSVIGSGPFSFPALPFFGNPTEYYLYAYRDLNGDGVPGSTEPLGGYGPFPFNDPAAHWTAPVDSVSTSGVTVNLIPRAEVTGQLFNNSGQSGQRLIVRAIDLAHPPHKWQTIEFPVGGGPFPYSLGGLVPTLNYTIEAWIDTQPKGSTGAYNPEPFEDKAPSAGPYAAFMGITTPNVDLTISSGALGGSTPDHIRLSGLNDSWGMTIASGVPSGDLTVSVRDFNDALTATGAPTALIFSGFDSGGSFSPELSTDAFATLFTTATLPGGQPFSGKFKFRYPGQGNVLLQAEAVNFPTAGESRYAFFSFNVLPGGAAFANLNARTVSDPATTTGTTTSITPDRDGVDDAAVLSCDPPDPNVYWECDLSTEPTFTTGILERFFGNGPGEVTWYGSAFDGRTVPNGTYFARFQTEGAGLVSSTLTVSVNTAFVRGTVTDAVFSPVADANVQINGPGGGGFARTANDGSFFVGGLTAGQTYNLDVSRPGFAPQSFAVAASSDVGNVVLGPGATLRVKATVDTAPPFDLYGNIFVHDASYSSVAGGPLHLAPGNTVSDNGLPAADPNFSNFTSMAVKPGVVYTVEINLPQYGHFTIPGQSTGPGQTVDVVQAMFRKANVAGALNFPAALSSPFGGEWISVDAVPTAPVGAPPAAWGGAFVPNGASSATFQMFGVSAGTYTLRAFARGFIQNSTTPVVVGNTDLSGVDFPPFSTGGTATGTITINGDTSGLAGGNFGGAACGAGQVPLPVHAFDPGSFVSAFTQVCVSTGPGPVTSALYQMNGLPDGTYELSAFLPGFQINPPGPKFVTVSGGVGNTDLTFDAFTGRLDIVAALPPGDLAGAVAYRLERDGPDRDERSGNLAGPVGGPATGSELALGTGLYTLTLLNGNPGRGLIRRIGVSVKNGSTTTATVDMAIPTYAVGGAVSLQGNLILPSTWSVTVSSMAGLTAAAVAPTVQVFAFPLPNHFDDRTKPLREIPVTPWAASGTFALNGLTPGGYLFRIKEDLNPPSPPANCNGCSAPPGLPEMASSDRVVFLTTAPVTGADLTLSNGAKLTGTLRRPVGDDSTDPRHFVLRLRRTDNLTVYETETDTNGTGAASYTIPHLAAGIYILEVYEKTPPVKYGAPAQTVEIANGDAALDVELVAAATLVGRLRDADTGTLITPANAGRFLPDRFEVFAEAKPFVPGGYANAERNENGPGPRLDPNTGQFTIARLIPDASYDVTFRGFSEFGRESQAKGLRTYAPVVLGGVRVAPGEIVDLGTVDLSQGGTLAGTVTDTDGAPLANIRLTAVPALTNGEDRHNFEIETFTDEQGHYEFHGVDRNQRYYDVIASPRFRSGDVFGQLAGTKYAEERVRMIDVNNPLKITGIDFALTAASGALIGTIRTVDGGTLVPAFENGNNQAGVRGANIVLHFDGAVLDDNPLGEIQETTSPDGTFRIDGLKPGAYTFRGIASGYSTALKKIVVAKTGATNAGTV